MLTRTCPLSGKFEQLHLQWAMLSHDKFRIGVSPSSGSSGFITVAEINESITLNSVIRAYSLVWSTCLKKNHAHIRLTSLYFSLSANRFDIQACLTILITSNGHRQKKNRSIPPSLPTNESSQWQGKHCLKQVLYLNKAAWLCFYDRRRVHAIERVSGLFAVDKQDYESPSQHIWEATMPQDIVKPKAGDCIEFDGWLGCCIDTINKQDLSLRKTLNHGWEELHPFHDSVNFTIDRAHYRM